MSTETDPPWPARVRYPYHSLEDFLTAEELTVDGVLDDGWGATFPVRGREIDAAVLFADITAFSARTVELDATETLAFVNHFFAWIAAEALRGRPGIIDKYIGDEVMVVFSKEFGSEDPFVDAVHAARGMAQNDVFAFAPHVGIARGEVIVGYVGTPLRYNCSVFGAPVAIAARCAGLPPISASHYSAAITFPASDWGDRDFATVFLPKRVRDSDGSIHEEPHGWELLDPRPAELKNLGTIEVRHAINHALWAPSQSATERAREGVAEIARAGRRWQRRRA